VCTEAPRTVIAQFERVLAPAELARAARFRVDHLRRSFVLARGALRALLAGYLRTSASGIEFKYGAKGKPSLAMASISFNASHSGSLAVFAFACGAEIGVDVERIRPMQEMQGIADHFFCPEEAAELMSLLPEERERAFFLCWTRKEAYIKALGDGLSIALNGFRVTMRPDQPARFIHLRGNTIAAKDWTLHDLQLTSNYAAALAYRDAERPVAIFTVTDPVALLGIA
jgi:4'-phosphopantetheinyl transferase